MGQMPQVGSPRPSIIMAIILSLCPAQPVFSSLSSPNPNSTHHPTTTHTS